eukprot:gene5429-4476_t
MVVLAAALYTANDWGLWQRTRLRDDETGFGTDEDAVYRAARLVESQAQWAEVQNAF